MPVKKTNILVAESDPQASRLLIRCLASAGYVVTAVMDEQQLFAALETEEPDFVLLDTISSESGDFKLCRQIRDTSLVPIMVMSARGEERDKAHALDAGADDYLTKPFSAIELLARVRAILRRSQWSTTEHSRNLQPTLTLGNLVVDFLQHQVTIGGRHVALTPIEYRLFSYLAQNAGRIVTHNLLLEKVWGKEYLGEHNLLKVHINRLRHKIEPDLAHPIYIVTRAGLGYLFPTEPVLALPEACEPSQRTAEGGGKTWVY